MKLESYLIFDGNCEEAILFYKDLFDGQITSMMHYSEAPPEMPVPENLRDKVMHCTLEFSGCNLMASDSMEGKVEQGKNYHLSLNIEGEKEAVAIFEGLSEQGEVIMPYETVFWGGKFGMLADQFGIRWMVSTEDKAQKAP